jgi:hypothetical protein
VGASDAGSSLSPQATSASDARTAAVTAVLRNRRDLDVLGPRRCLAGALADVSVDHAALAVAKRR